MLRLKSDLLELFDGIATGTLSERDVNIDPRTAATIMMVSEGYPNKYEKGKEIDGLDEITEQVVFHAGTTRNEKGKVITNGGRVLAVSAYGKDMNTAVKKAYEGVDKLKYEGKNFRKDIGFDLMKKK